MMKKLEKLKKTKAYGCSVHGVSYGIFKKEKIDGETMSYFIYT